MDYDLRPSDLHYYDGQVVAHRQEAAGMSRRNTLRVAYSIKWSTTGISPRTVTIFDLHKRFRS